MDKLDAYNLIFSLAGLPPVNSASTANNNVAIVGEALEFAKRRIIRKHWRKFAVRTDLQVNGDGKIPTSGYLKIVYPNNLRDRLTERNGYVWDQREDNFRGEEIQDAWVVSDVDYDSISSESWQEYIAYEAALRFYQQFADVDANYVEINRLRNTARIQASREVRYSIDGTFGISKATRGFYE